jgi:Na+/phosphate symporter
MINVVLKEHVQRGGEALERYLRRIIREELHNKDSRSQIHSIP